MEEEIKKDALDSVNFVEKIEKINLDFDKYVIFTDGDIQLVYENGEFFVVSSTDIYSKKEKKEKEEAKNMYLEYFIRYILNPIIKQREKSVPTKERKTPKIEKSLNKERKSKEKEVEIKDKEPEKVKEKEKIKDEEDKMLEI